MQKHKLWWGLQMNRDCPARLELFPWSPKRSRCAPALSWSSPVFPDKFWTFSLRWLSLSLTEISHCREKPSEFPQGAPTAGHHLLQMKTTLWMGCWWFLDFPQYLLFHIFLKYQWFIPSHFVLEMECFPSISVENCMWKFSQDGTPTTMLDFCGTQMSKILT